MSPRAAETLFAARRYAAGLRRRTVRAEGFEIPYLEGGHGDPLVLLHGFGDTKDSFVEAAGGLTRRHRVVLPDLPGFGDTVGPEGFDYTLPNLAFVLEAFLDAVAPGPVDLGGNSLGGAVAAHFALEHPGRVQSLALVDAAGVRMPMPSLLQQRLDAGDNPFVIETFEEHEAFLRMVLEVPRRSPGPCAATSPRCSSSVQPGTTKS